MAWARNGDVDLWYERSGDGRPLLYISGTGSDLRLHPNAFDGPLASRLDVLAYDQRGQGRSSRPDRPDSMADYAEDAVALLDAVGWPRCSVLGYSFGGMVAQELAIRAPDRVDRLVLVCTSSGGAGGSSFPLHELESLPDDERFAKLLAVSDTRLDEDWQKANPDAVAHLVSLVAGREGLADPRQLDARSRHDTFGRLAAISAATFVVAGRYDGIAPVENAEALTAGIGDSRLEIFEGGHLVLMQDPKAYEAIADFVAA